MLGVAQQREIRGLTARVREAYRLPPAETQLPISSLATVVGPGMRPDEVEAALRPISGEIARTEWHTATDLKGDRYVMQSLVFELRGPGVFRVEIVYFDGRVSNIDIADYVLEGTWISADSARGLLHANTQPGGA